MERQIRRRKKSAPERRPMTSAVLTSPENVSYLKRNQPKNDDVQNKKEKSIKKATAVTAKRDSRKTNTAQTNRPRQ